MSKRSLGLGLSWAQGLLFPAEGWMLDLGDSEARASSSSSSKQCVLDRDRGVFGSNGRE
jgi:hypothetical protein